MYLKKVDKIVGLYQALSKEEKISLFLQLQDLDMRDHYDPSSKRYRVQAKNYYGMYLIDRNEISYNERQANARLHRVLYLHHFNSWNAMYEKGMNEKELMRFRSMTYKELIVTEIKAPNEANKNG